MTYVKIKLKNKGKSVLINQIKTVKISVVTAINIFGLRFVLKEKTLKTF